ncbi:MAG: SpoIIE family protein phosphatase [Chitinivibrionales bacterium]|nr:SpoIIE family protein phosphatase [Chitinivibrionales bacterium]
MKRRILVVDDNKSIHDDIKNVIGLSRRETDREINQLADELFGDEAGIEQAPVSERIEYQIDDAYQGEQAVEMVRRAEEINDPYALIFMDVRMPPGMDGIKAIKEIWSGHPDIEIVICTAYSDYSWNDILNELGTSDKLLFLRKPFDAVALKQTALALTKKWHLALENRHYINNLEDKIKERTQKLNDTLSEREFYIQQIQNELDLAERVQHQFLPESIPEFELLLLAAKYIPCAKVGGDLYDIVQLDAKTVAIYIFDVSGHGIAASLITAIGKASFRSHLQKSHSPGEILERVNKDITACTTPEMYVTAFIMILDLEHRTATYSSAGHVPPQYFKKRQNCLHSLKSTGFYLGLFDDAEYPVVSVQFEEGDKIIMYTDGFTEVFDDNRKMFGKKGLHDVVQKYAAQMNCKMFLDTILKVNTEYMQHQERSDDVCVVVVEIAQSQFVAGLARVLPGNESVYQLNYTRINREADIDGCCNVILKELDRNGFDDRTIKQMRVVIIEILLKAVKQGNNDNRDLWVHIAYHVNTERILIGVADEGKRFNYQHALEADANLQPLEDAANIGLHLVKSFVDSLKFIDGGKSPVVITYRKKDTPE